MKKFSKFLILLLSFLKHYDFDKFILKEGYIRTNLVKYENPVVIEDLTKKIEKNSYIFIKILKLLSIDKKDIKVSYHSSFLTEDNKKVIIVYFIDLKDLKFRGIKVEFLYNLEIKKFEEIIYYIKIPYD
ncbi:MAG: hypothetical protein ABDH37_00760 [Candidatus Hydrothermales bacterium]